MRTLLRYLLFILLFSSPGLVLGETGISGNFTPDTDSISPPPPGPGYSITGPEFACAGDTCFYETEGAIGCSIQWYINGQYQPGNTSVLQVTWPSLGIQTIEALIVCGNEDPLEYMKETIVNVVPFPIQIWGDTLVCDSTYHTYYTSAGPYDTCYWTVNGILQPSTAPAMIYFFESPGEYEIGVTVDNNCGTSDPLMLEVTAQGSAPAPPEPIQGPDTSCVGNTEVFTTVITAGLPCEWMVNNVVQPTTSTTLEITWQDPGFYHIEARAVGDCGTSNPVAHEVTVGYHPDVDLGPDTTIIMGQVLKLNAGNPGCNYLWSTGDTTRTILVEEAGTYSVTATNFCGADWDEIDVSIIVSTQGPCPENAARIYGYDRKIFIEGITGRIGKVTVISLGGHTVYSGEYTAEISVPAAGVYLVGIRMEEAVLTRKVFVP